MPGRALPTPSGPPDMKQEKDANGLTEARKDDSKLLVPDLALVRSWGCDDGGRPGQACRGVSLRGRGFISTPGRLH